MRGWLLNAKIVELLSRPKLCSEPTGLLPPACPCLGWLSRIYIFWRYPRVGPPCVADVPVRRTQLSQPLLKLYLRGLYPTCQLLGNLFMERPKLIL
jgi:hypothetical protein